MNKSSEELIQAANDKQDAGDREAAFALYEECLSLDVDNPVALRQLGLHYWGYRKNPDKAREMLERCIAICDDVEAHFFLAHAYESLGWIDKARSEFEVAITGYPTQEKGFGMQSTLHKHYADFLAVHYDFPCAEEHYKKALLIDPDSEPAQKGYAELKRCMAHHEANSAGKLVI